MGVARLEDYRKPPGEVVEHRVADTDDGFMRVANELTDSILMADLTARQLKVMLAIMRKTYGFNKAMDRLTNTQISAMTGIHHTHVCVAKRQLLDRGFLIGSGQRIGINKHVSMWDMKNVSHISETLAKSANKSLAKSANTHLPTQLNTKDNIQKTERQLNTSSSCDDREPVKPERRKAVRINYEEYLEAYNEIVGDKLPHAVEANAERQRKLKKLIDSLATKNIDGFRAYVGAFMRAARPFHFGDNDRGWVANFDYLLRPKVLTDIREGTL